MKPRPWGTGWLGAAFLILLHAAPLAFVLWQAATNP
jgi:hypothetical protein